MFENKFPSLIDQFVAQSDDTRSDERLDITFIHPDTGNKMKMKLCLADLVKWRENQLIQNALPYLNMEEREFLITGLLPEDFDLGPRRNM